MLSVNPIARVVVNAVRTSASPASFDTGLILIKDVNYTDARRLAAVDDSAAAVSQLTAWGFTSATEAYKAAVKYFAASPSPSRLLLSCYPTSETPVQALTAVLDVTASFYGIAFGQTETDARILDSCRSSGRRPPSWLPEACCRRCTAGLPSAPCPSSARRFRMPPP